MRMPLLAFAAVAAVAGSYVVNAGTAEPSKVSFAKNVQPVFDEYCVVCHQTGGEQEGLNLESGQAYGKLVGIKSVQSPLKLVEPGKPEASYLLIKMEGTQAQHGGRGMRMPFGDVPDPKATAIVRQWIAEGAVAE